MGLLNSHQILPGARTAGGDKTYALANVITAPSVTVGADADVDLISFNGGSIEVEGQRFSFATGQHAIKFSELASLLTAGRQYVICAVPQYNEPVSQVAAESAGVPYFVERNSNNEYIAKLYMPSAIASAVAAKGGIDALTKLVNMGAASASDMTVYNQYWEYQQRHIDPRYVPMPLLPNGVRLVLAEVVAVDNSTKRNALYDKSAADFQLLRSQLGHIYTERLVFTDSAADTRYISAGKRHLIQSARGYSSANNARDDVRDASNGYLIDVNAGGFSNFASVSSPANPTHIAVTEFTYPSNMAPGQTFNSQEVVTRFITQGQVAGLSLSATPANAFGRINPLYLDNPVAQSRFPLAAPLSRLTNYADPCPLVRVSLGAGSAVTIQRNIFEGYLG